MPLALPALENPSPSQAPPGPPRHIGKSPVPAVPGASPRLASSAAPSIRPSVQPATGDPLGAAPRRHRPPRIPVSSDSLAGHAASRRHARRIHPRVKHHPLIPPRRRSAPVATRPGSARPAAAKPGPAEPPPTTRCGHVSPLAARALPRHVLRLRICSPPRALCAQGPAKLSARCARGNFCHFRRNFSCAKFPPPPLRAGA